MHLPIDLKSYLNRNVKKITLVLIFINNILNIFLKKYITQHDWIEYFEKNRYGKKHAIIVFGIIFLAKRFHCIHTANSIPKTSLWQLKKSAKKT